MSSQKRRKNKHATASKSSNDDSASRLPRGVSDRLVLANVDSILPGEALLLLVSGTAAAKYLIGARLDVSWNVHTFEHFYLTSLIKSLSEDSDVAESADVELFCTPDLPDVTVDTVVFPTDSRGASELTRDLLQSVERILKPNGRLIASTNNPKDHWLHEHLKDTFGRVTVIKEKEGICYIARKSSRSVKQKDFSCEFAFRDGERLIRCASRPGVFSHRRVDAGARALIRSLDLLDQSKQGQKRVRKIVELGCGSGAVSTAAALRYPQATVLAVDSHVRAVQATEQTAALNDAKNVSVMLTADGNLPDPETYDLLLCNPPYYSDYRISELFLHAASDALRPGGRIHLVTKRTDWHENRMIEFFANATTHKFGEYDVVVSTQ